MQKDNLPRWSGQPGFYEVYYLKWNLPDEQAACWVRYTLTSPLPGKGEPFCEVWGIFFDAQNPDNNFALKNRFPVQKLSLERNPFRIQVSDAFLSMDASRGTLLDEKGEPLLAWELAIESKGPPFHHLPYEWMYDSPFPKTKALAPREDARFSGFLKAGKRELRFEHAPGQQAHLWGTKHAHRWVWAHCNLFQETRELLWEGLDSRIKLGPFTSPRIPLFHLRWEGKSYFFNRITHIVRNNSRWDLGWWSFRHRTEDLEVEGRASCEPERFVGVTYTDPDGETLVCNNTKVADLELLLKPKGRASALRFTAKGTCALEFVDRSPRPEVPVKL